MFRRFLHFMFASATLACAAATLPAQSVEPGVAPAVVRCPPPCGPDRICPMIACARPMVAQ
ncbi:MAG: hypothetical protein ACHQSE_11640, partial [Gemmatimonadales bacterium]